MSINPILPLKGQTLSVTDYTNAHLVHFKALICYILDPSQPPCFTGEYSPVKVCPELLKVLQSHKQFDIFCKLDTRPDGHYLWLKANYDTEYAHWAAKQAAHNASRADMLEENERQAKAFQVYVSWQRTKKVRTGIESLFDMFNEMVRDYKECKDESPYIGILKKIKYIQ